jgi:hypothetical protein
MTNYKFTKQEIMKTLRGNSKDSLPSNEFKSKLESKLLEKTAKDSKQSIFEFFEKYRRVLLSTLGSLSIFTLVTFLIFSQKPPVLVTDLDQFESPYLTQNGIDLTGISDLIKLNPGEFEREAKEKDSEGKSFTDLFSFEKTSSLSESSADMMLVEPTLPGEYIEATLSGGSVDDNLDFTQFLQYIKDQEFEEQIGDIFVERHLIKIINSNGERVPFQKIKVVDFENNQYDLFSYSNGEVYFFPNSYKYAEVQQIQSDIYKVTINGKTIGFNSDEETWIFKLDEVYPINMELQTDEITLDLVFTIDTTGSMGDQIDKLKETMDSISKTIKSKYPNIKIRYALVAYRDISDEYLTRVYDFTSNLTTYREYLNQLEANGGGDYEEDMNSGLKDSIENLSWTTTGNSLKLDFLIADAPPHTDYQQMYTYETAMYRAAELGIKIFPIASSGLDNSHGELIMRKIALITNAEYIFITNSSGGTDYHVGEQQFQVSNLDGLIIDVIENEMDVL